MPANLEEIESLVGQSSSGRGREALMKRIAQDPSSPLLYRENDTLVGILVFEEAPWESRILERKVAKLSFIRGDKRLSYDALVSAARNLLAQLDDRMMEGGFKMISVRVSERSAGLIHALEQNGFRFIEVLLTFRHDLKDLDDFGDSHFIRASNKGDIEEVCAVAFNSFSFSRFHSDPLIAPAQANLSRAEWVRKACEGSADEVFVAVEDNTIAGFITCRILSNGGNDARGIIDLTAVLPQFRGRGIGSSLVKRAQLYFRGKAEAVSVGTQSKNIPSIGLYQKLGFRPVSSEVTLHKHYSQ
ncbi:GNAT family N-acetyltransferase [Candidatus Poribacteria bacterium]|nr:GNAT family N-acetyltransferase [Candidatus Poribacteria bacterium]